MASIKVCDHCHTRIYEDEEDYVWSKIKPTTSKGRRIPARMIYMHKRCYDKLYPKKSDPK